VPAPAQVVGSAARAARLWRRRQPWRAAERAALLAAPLFAPHRRRRLLLLRDRHRHRPLGAPPAQLLSLLLGLLLGLLLAAGPEDKDIDGRLILTREQQAEAFAAAANI